MLLGAGAVFDATLIGAEQLAPLAGLRVGRPDFDAQAAEADARSTGRQGAAGQTAEGSPKGETSGASESIFTASTLSLAR